jgi:hypothetical protein
VPQAQKYRPNPDDIRIALEQLSLLSGYEKLIANEKGLKLFASAVASFADDRERTHEILFPDGRKIIPLNWLLEEIMKTCIFLPMPIQMRRIYEEYFSPLDGRYASQLESIADGE